MDGQGTFCAKCGDRLPGGADFCPKCGTAVFKEAIAQSEQASASAIPKSPDRSLQVDIWLGVLLLWLAGQLYNLGSGDSMLYSGDPPTIIGALLGMATFLSIWFIAGSRLRIISHLTKPAAQRGIPHWGVYITIGALWLLFATLTDGLLGLFIGILYMAYASLVGFTCYSLSRRFRKEFSGRAMLFGRIGLIGWLVPPLGFILAVGCLYASIESEDAKRIRTGILLSSLIIILSMISSGIGASKARTIGDEFRFEDLNTGLTLDRATSSEDLTELLSSCDEKARHEVDALGERIEWTQTIDNSEVQYSITRQSPPGELALCNENTGWETVITRVKYTILSAEIISYDLGEEYTCTYYFPVTHVPSTKRGLKLGDRLERASRIYGKPLESRIEEDSFPIENVQFEDSWGAILMITIDRATGRIVGLSVCDAEPITS